MNNTASKNIPDSKRTLYLDIVRTFAVICITLNHAVNRSYDNYVNQCKEYFESSFLSTFIKTFITVLSHVGVPLFLMITGVLILNKSFENPDNIKKFIKNNYLNLFITTEIWIFITFWFIIFLFPENMVLEKNGVLGTIDILIKNMFFTDWTSSGVYQTSFPSLWYMPMILCLYPLLPFISILLKNYSPKLLALPIAVTYLYFMVLPLINQQFRFNGLETVKPYLKDYNLPSFLLIYVIIGYFVGKGLLSKFKDYQILLLAIFSFALCFSYQWFAYSMPQNYIVDYNFPLLPIVAGFIFEYIKRKAHLFKRFAPFFTYISKVSFGIYFVHILIMDYINNNHDLSFMSYSVKMLFLEIVALIGSILIIFLLSKVKILGKYLFMVK